MAPRGLVACLKLQSGWIDGKLTFMDTFSREQRSEVMRRVKGTDTQPELIVRRMLHRAGFRYRLHVKTLPGKPDMVLPRYKTVIFVHGCFWHGHTACKCEHRVCSSRHTESATRA